MDKFEFIRESNRIEGISREPLYVEVEEYDRFMALEEVTVSDLEQFVKTYQPKAVLRDRIGLNVCVGNHFPPLGGPDIKDALIDLLMEAERTYQSAYEIHLKYETMHPFTDGNGRSGRMLWLWQMKKAPLGFLHTFYYQTLAFERGESAIRHNNYTVSHPPEHCPDCRTRTGGGRCQRCCEEE